MIKAFLKNFSRNSSSQIRFASRLSYVRRSTCPVCRKFSSKVHIFIKFGENDLPILSCGCGALFYPGAKAPDYEIAESRSSFFLRIDQAESIDASVMPLFASPDLDSFSVIDIGCGLGFASSYVRFLGRECLAFDPGSAARLSTEILKIPISQDYATVFNTRTKNPKLVFASEVLEHVDDPLSFLQSLKEITGESGYVMITTPNAEFVTRDNSKNTILSILAPGQHLFLLDEKSLSKIMLSAGFSWVKTWTNEERLFAIAGPKEVSLSNSFSQTDFLSYLAFNLEDQRVSKIIRYRSYGYRLFKEYVNLGQYEEGSNIFAELTEAYSELGLKLDDPRSILAKLNSVTDNGFSLPSPEQYPFNLALLMYLQGIVLIAYRHDRIGAAPYFKAAMEISDLYRNVYTTNNLGGYDSELQSVKGRALHQIELHSIQIPKD